jgi:hypothetical protein
MIKKVFLIGILMASTMPVSAQCVEVKGVETKMTGEIPSDCFYCNGYGDFSFSNLNNYTVTIEAELRRPACAGEGGPSYVTIATKTFVIEAKETYNWHTIRIFDHSKCGKMDTYVIFKVFKCP